MPALGFFLLAGAVSPTVVRSSALLQAVATDTAPRMPGRMPGSRCPFQLAAGSRVGVRS